MSVYDVRFSGRDKRGNVVHSTEFTYRFVRPCGCTHVAMATWATNADAAFHERWAQANTLCPKCDLPRSHAQEEDRNETARPPAQEGLKRRPLRPRA